MHHAHVFEKTLGLCIMFLGGKVLNKEGGKWNVGVVNFFTKVVDLKYEACWKYGKHLFIGINKYPYTLALNKLIVLIKLE